MRMKVSPPEPRLFAFELLAAADKVLDGRVEFAPTRIHVEAVVKGLLAG